LLRCLFGNPFLPSGTIIIPEAAARTGTSLATSIYQERAFDRMPALADVLEKAGCTDAEVLAHCRGPGAHARGCHVVDAILGKQ
jgi:hypothetical protein